VREGNRELPNTELCVTLISTRNFSEAGHKVWTNKGAPGIDGVKVAELQKILNEKFPEIKSRIIARTYRPLPARRVEIPKPNGKKRKLGIPSVIDRVVQQAVVQVITPMFEETFSDSSFGYRPNRSAEDAVRKAQEYMDDGYEYVVDLDLSQFFDTVNHDILLNEIDKTLKDKDIRRLIFSFLKAGVMINGLKEETEEGTPQGGVISPILANIYLTPFDNFLDNRGIKFIRYADDIQVFSKSKTASRRLKKTIIEFLEKKLKLKVNEEKTEARKAWGSKILGFVFMSATKWHLEDVDKWYTVPRKEAWDKVKENVRRITKRNRGVSLEQVISELNSSLRGWINYYARSFMLKKLKDKLMPWVRRKIRQYAYKIWKTAKNRKHKLRQLGNEEWRFKREGFSNRGYWKMSMVMGAFITNSMIHADLGLIDCIEIYKDSHDQKLFHDKIIKKYPRLMCKGIIQS